MTKEQEVIEYFKEQIDVCFKNAEICDDNNFDEEATYLREESYMLETALNILKEKDKEIEKLKKHNKELLRKLRNRVKEVKKLNKYSLYKKEFKTLNEQLKNKDRIIDLTIEEYEYNARINLKDFCDNELRKNTCIQDCKICIKQYFKSKVEKE